MGNHNDCGRCVFWVYQSYGDLGNVSELPCFDTSPCLQKGDPSSWLSLPTNSYNYLAFLGTRFGLIESPSWSLINLIAWLILRPVDLKPTLNSVLYKWFLPCIIEAGSSSKALSVQGNKVPRLHACTSNQTRSLETLSFLRIAWSRCLQVFSRFLTSSSRVSFANLTMRIFEVWERLVGPSITSA